MIVLDTNVLSEPLKSMPTTRVVEWLDDQAAVTLFMTTISRAKLRFGVLKMPDGKRKNAMIQTRFPRRFTGAVSLEAPRYPTTSLP